MLDGIYEQDSVSVLSGVTLQAVDSNARPLVVGTDGFPPGIGRGNGSIIKNVWFGGNKAVVERAITMADGCTTEGCTFFNYYGGFAEGSHIDNLYKNNRFIGCGTDTHYHDIYISGDTRATIDGNIHIGGEGYKIHLWHYVANTNIVNNFVHSNKYGIVVSNTNNTATKNILWNHGLFLAGNTYCTVTNNLHGPNCYPGGMDANMGTGTILINNTCVTPTIPDADESSPVIWSVSDFSNNLGYTVEQIDDAVSYIETVFTTQTVQQIHSDSNIENNFSILRNILNTWKNT